MPQFFLSPESIADKTFRLSGPEAFHIVKVLRCREGQALALFDGQGRRFEGVIRKIHPDGSISGELSGLRAQTRRMELNLYPGLLKTGGWHYLLEKGTEIGVTAFAPVISARCVAQSPKPERAAAKLERWRRIIMAAAKQCQRQDLPEMRPPVSLSEAFESCAGRGLSLLAWEEQGGLAAESLPRAVKQARDKNDGEIPPVNLFIGPEGGFCAQEAALARDRGVIVIGLGPRILRAETAALAASALVLYELVVL
ncbi:MAG: hypothetical protein A3J74_09765 [Elusimicrobia bacterium RIFCSPHIGHO2_02_FULL_57_9]|nr:MAG: hypothetical protein A3J74_09765 [Elusimicrobia bacterium RIFCSPHIGHO2_02_FULL_57_9]